jgi:prolyl oligopeptidase
VKWRRRAGGAWLGAILALQTAVIHAQHAPETPTEATVESFFGVTVDDRYRWIEDLRSTATQDWLTAQNDFTRATLDALPGREALLRRIGELNNARTEIRALQSAGDALFYLKRLPGEPRFRLYARDGAAGAERLIYDAATLTAAGPSTGIVYYRASPNGKRIALGIAEGDSENVSLHVIDADTGRALGPPVRRARFGLPNWRFDSDALFYTRQGDPGTTASPPEGQRDSRVFMRSVGDDRNPPDIAILGRGLAAGIELSPDDLPAVVTSPISPFAIGVVRHGVERALTLYVAPLAQVHDAGTPWRRLVGTEGGITSFALRGEWIYFVSNEGAPRGQVLRWSLRDTRPFALAQAEPVVAPGELVVERIVAAKDALYVHLSDAGYAMLLRLEYNVKLAKPAPPPRRGARAATPRGPAALPKLSGIARGSEVPLPFAGAVDELVADPLRSGAYFRLAGWTRAPVYFGIDGKSGQVGAIGWAGQANADIGRLTAQQVMVRSHDGVEVPLTIVHARDIVRNGTAPLLVEAYGAYGRSREPSYWPSLLAWLERGGVFAVAHVRGGGELGSEWHRGGFQATKANTWRDLIACTEYLVTQRWTAPARLAVMGVGAGAIAAGNAIVDRPDLFAAWVSVAGLHDTLRNETGLVEPANAPELGAPATADAFRTLLAMSTYARLRDGERYPAALLTTGLHDAQTAPWDPAKTAARLQAINTGFGGSGKPALLRVDATAGHVMLTLPQTIALDTDLFAFLLWQTGATGFAPN